MIRFDGWSSDSEYSIKNSGFFFGDRLMLCCDKLTDVDMELKTNAGKWNVRGEISQLEDGPIRLCAWLDIQHHLPTANEQFELSMHLIINVGEILTSFCPVIT